MFCGNSVTSFSHLQVASIDLCFCVSHGAHCDFLLSSGSLKDYVLPNAMVRPHILFVFLFYVSAFVLSFQPHLTWLITLSFYKPFLCLLRYQFLPVLFSIDDSFLFFFAELTVFFFFNWRMVDLKGYVSCTAK